MGGATTGPQSIQDFTVTRRRVASASHLQHTQHRQEGVCSCCCYVYRVSHQVIDLVTGKVVTRSFVYVIGELIRFRKSNIRYVDTISQHFQEYVKSLFRLDRRTGSWEKIN